jgi:hypothetical protein
MISKGAPTRGRYCCGVVASTTASIRFLTGIESRELEALADLQGSGLHGTPSRGDPDGSRHLQRPDKDDPQGLSSPGEFQNHGLQFAADDTQLGPSPEGEACNGDESRDRRQSLTGLGFRSRGRAPTSRRCPKRAPWPTPAAP